MAVGLNHDAQCPGGKMSFVNEYISAEDAEKYQLEEIDKQFFPGTHARDWTIDRVRNIYLRNVELGGGSDPDLRNQYKWTLYWHGDLLLLGTELLDHGGEIGQPGWSHWKLTSLDLPEQLRPYKEDILADLNEALLAYKGSGIYSTNTEYEITVDIGGDVI